jgi:hypothetical protein
MRRPAALALALSFAGAGYPLASTPDTSAHANSNEAVLDEAWQTVRDHFYDPNLRGLDWASARAMRLRRLRLSPRMSWLQ